MKNDTWKRDNLCFNLFRTKHTHTHTNPRASQAIHTHTHTAMSDDVEEKIGHRYNTYRSKAHIQICCSVSLCIVTHRESIYMAPNHKRENQIKSIIKSVLGHSIYALCSMQPVRLTLICLSSSRLLCCIELVGWFAISHTPGRPALETFSFRIERISYHFIHSLTDECKSVCVCVWCCRACQTIEESIVISMSLA